MQILLVCPAGMGKTYYIIQQIKHSPENQKWCFIAPLRAIVEEVYFKLDSQNINCLNLKANHPFEFIQKFKAIVATSNMLTEESFNYFNNRSYIFVFDEFHLIFRWGNQFREDLNQLYYLLISQAHFCFFLSATMEDRFLDSLQRDLAREQREIFYLDYGNLYVNFRQIKMMTYLGKSMSHRRKILQRCSNLLLMNRRILIFVQYRRQVEELKKYFQDLPVKILTAVGGEGAEFSQKIQAYQNSVQLIVATSVLSHGINLPVLDHLIILYPVKKRDFWVQMVYRGGRRGESFYLHHFDRDFVSYRQIGKGLLWRMYLWMQIQWSKIKARVCRELF